MAAYRAASHDLPGMKDADSKQIVPMKRLDPRAWECRTRLPGIRPGRGASHAEHQQSVLKKDTDSNHLLFLNKANNGVLSLLERCVQQSLFCVGSSEAPAQLSREEPGENPDTYSTNRILTSRKAQTANILMS